MAQISAPSDSSEGHNAPWRRWRTLVVVGVSIALVGTAAGLGALALFGHRRARPQLVGDPRASGDAATIAVVLERFLQTERFHVTVTVRVQLVHTDVQRGFIDFARVG